MIDEFYNNTTKGPQGLGREEEEVKPRFKGMQLGEFPRCPKCNGAILKEVSPQNNKVLVCTMCTTMFNESNGKISERGV